jgi:type II secretory pathway pseudopilin PulG
MLLRYHDGMEEIKIDDRPIPEPVDWTPDRNSDDFAAGFSYALGSNDEEKTFPDELFEPFLPQTGEMMARSERSRGLTMRKAVQTAANAMITGAELAKENTREILVSGGVAVLFVAAILGGPKLSEMRKDSKARAAEEAEAARAVRIEQYEDGYPGWDFSTDSLSVKQVTMSRDGSPYIADFIRDVANDLGTTYQDAVKILNDLNGGSLIDNIKRDQISTGFWYAYVPGRDSGELSEP